MNILVRIALGAVGALALAGGAQAHGGVRWSVTVGSPGFGVYVPAPVVIVPPPIQAPPLFIDPAPYYGAPYYGVPYYYPAPRARYYAPPRGYYGRHHYRQRPHYVARPSYRHQGERWQHGGRHHHR